MLSKLYSSPVSESSKCVATFVLIPDEAWMCLLFFGSFCSAEGLCLLRTVNVSGRVNCLITRLISIWPSLIWALMGLCCLGFVCVCVCVCLWCTVRASFSCLIVAGKRTCITRVSVPNWLSTYINFSVSIGYWIMFVHFPDFLQWTFAVIKHSVNLKKNTI